MKRYTVKQLARLAGVSVRALHHYDELGLLKPAEVGANGYRYYGREELLRLQQILLHRELELPLEAIRAVLASPAAHRTAVLRHHREVLALKAKRYRRLVRTLDETLTVLEGETEVEGKNLYKGFAPEKQAEYEAWLVDRGGETMQSAIDASKQHMKGWSKADWQQAGKQWDEIEGSVAKALADGLPIESETVRKLMRRHYDWIAGSWGRKPEQMNYARLGEIYLGHPDFRARFEKRQAGLAEYLAAAMKSFAEAELAS